MPYNRINEKAKNESKLLFSCIIPSNVTNDTRILGKWKLLSTDHNCYIDYVPEPGYGKNNIIKFDDSIVSGYYLDSNDLKSEKESILKGKWFVKNHNLYICYTLILKSSYFLPDTINEKWSYYKYDIENESTMVWEADCFRYRYHKVK
jgi:hypothetical protein